MNNHGHPPGHGGRRPMGRAVVLLALTLAAEIAGGYLSGSIALLADAGHVFTDMAALLFSYAAMRLSDRPPAPTRTFGLHRIEVLAALTNGALVIALAVGIAAGALSRFGNPAPVHHAPMLAVALGGLAVNLFVAWDLHAFAKRDINVRGAFLHVLGDALSSLLVVIGAVAIRATGLYVIDPLLALFVAAVIIVGAVRLLSESVHILLEGAPRHIKTDDVAAALKSISGVRAVPDLHLWSLCSNVCFLSAHVKVDASGMAKQREILNDIRNRMKNGFGLTHTTIQIECTDWPPSDPA